MGRDSRRIDLQNLKRVYSNGGCKIWRSHQKVSEARKARVSQDTMGIILTDIPKKKKYSKKL